MYFIAGVTGHVGGAAARRLLEEGHTVRTLARDPQRAASWSAKGVEVRKGDLNDAASLADALHEVEGAFLMIPPLLAPSPDFSEAKAVIASFVQALRQAAPPRLVALSSFGSEQGSGLGLITSTHLMEEALNGLAMPTAYVRPGSFYENNAAAFEPAAKTGTLYSLLQPTDRRVPMTATEDIGNEIAKLLAEGWGGKKIVEIGSRISPDELARAMGEALGRTVEAQAVPREGWAAALESFGFPAGRTGAYEEMMDGVNSGWIDFGVPGTEHVAGTMTPTQFFSQLGKG